MSEAIAYAAFRTLADGSWHSGEEIGASLGVSRAAVSQSINLLADAGVAIERTRSKGYRLPAPVDLLQTKQIEAARAAVAKRLGSKLAMTLATADIVDSTNSVLLAATGTLKHPHALAAEWQTRGRGRLGRTWLAPPGDALTLSLSWRFDAGAAALSGLSLATSVAVARALADAGLTSALGLRVKWPNDLLCDGAKLCGILVEAQGDMLGPTTVIVGVGINYRLPQTAMEAITQAATSYCAVTPEAQRVNRNALLGSVIAHLAHALDSFAAHGFAAFRDEWQSLHAHTGKRIRYIEAGQPHVGTALGVDAQGALIVEIAGHTRCLTSAEVESL
jgi:BirA family biotin operon repressor/biotin-[acetyl-CoA-carboxylase] ligase